MRYLLLAFLFPACDTNVSEPKEECPRHTVECYGECVPIDEILLYDEECIEGKYNDE